MQGVQSVDIASMRIWFLLGFVFLFFTLIGLATAVARVSAAPILPDDSELGILFSSNYSNGRGIFWMRPDGSESEQAFSFSDPRIPGNGAVWASLSPDGSAVMFLFRPPDTTLFRLSLLDLESGNIAQLTDDKTWIIDPHWSPDSSKIAYAAGGMGNEVYVIDVGTGAEWLVAAISGLGLSQYASMSWAPDGNRLALDYLIHQESRGYLGIFIVNVDGSDLHMVSQPGKSANAPTWDASGSLLYYACRGNAYRLTAICLMDMERGLSERLADMANYIPEQEIIQTIAISPGGQIAFTNSRYFGPGDQLYLFNPASDEVSRLRVYNAVDNSLQWAYRPRLP